MKNTTKLRMFLLGLTLTGATMTGVAHADRCVPDPNAICPLIFAPVECKGGVVFSNQCFADAACAKGL